MNGKLMLRILGQTLLVEALCLVVPLAVALLYREDPLPFLNTIFLLAITGTIMSRVKAKADFYTREGFAVVGLIWLALSFFGAFPFWFSGHFASFTDCFFEVVSGFTTTGASILTDIESLPKGLLFWRSFSSWVGGLTPLRAASMVSTAMCSRFPSPSSPRSAPVS